MVRFDLACQPAKVRTYPVCFRERRLAVLFSLKRAEFDSIRLDFGRIAVYALSLKFERFFRRSAF